MSGRVQKKKPEPKRPLSAYLLYIQAHRERVSKQNPSQFLQVIGAEWKKLGKKGKAPYEKEAAELKVDFERRNPKKEKEPVKKPDGPPKRPLSAYMCYMQAHRERATKENPSVYHTQIMTILGAEWKALSKEAKEPYEDEAADLKDDYVNEMANRRRPTKWVLGGTAGPVSAGNGGGVMASTSEKKKTPPPSDDDDELAEEEEEEEA